MNANQRAALARLEAIHTCALAANRDLTDAESDEWLKIRKDFDMPEALKQPDPATLRRADNPSATVVTKVRRYSLLKAIGGLMLGDTNAGDIGLEREVHQHLSQGKSFKGIAVPYNSFLKTAAGQDSLSAGPGGVLAMTDQLLADLLAETGDAILKATVLGPLGVGVVAVTAAQKVRVPIKTGRGQAGFVSRDGAGTVHDLVFSDTDAEAHSLAIAARLNRSSLIYTPQMSAIVESDLRESFTDAVNDAYLNADGTANAPIGIVKNLQTATAQDFTGEIATGINKAVITAFQNDHVGSYAEVGPSRRWLLHPDVVLAVTCSPVWAGALQPISDGKTLCGYPIVESYRAQKGGTPYAIFGDFDQTYAIMFGPAIDLLANPFDSSVYLAGGILLRGISDLDFLVRDRLRLAMASDAQHAASLPA